MMGGWCADGDGSGIDAVDCIYHLFVKNAHKWMAQNPDDFVPEPGELVSSIYLFFDCHVLASATEGGRRWMTQCLRLKSGLSKRGELIVYVLVKLDFRLYR